MNHFQSLVFPRYFIACVSSLVFCGNENSVSRYEHLGNMCAVAYYVAAGGGNAATVQAAVQAATAASAALAPDAAAAAAAIILVGLVHVVDGDAGG